MTTIRLTMTGSTVYPPSKIPTKLEPITVEATSHSETDAINACIHKLSGILSRRDSGLDR